MFTSTGRPLNRWPNSTQLTLLPKLVQVQIQSDIKTQSDMVQVIGLFLII
jgi:hypothetical protein